jgi:6-phosphogluconate dehydrogenase
MKSYIGIVGLAVMGENLARNMLRNGYAVAGFNRSQEKVDTFLKNANTDKAFGTTSLDDFLNNLESPKRIMMMVKAGSAVDEMIEQLRPKLIPGDILIDGGNEQFTNTVRRIKSFEGTGIHYIGTGVSGGEEGALWGPAIMPGGSTEAWPHVEELFKKIAAKADDGAPCCEWIGSGGAGNFVKMVHNGIEYGDMQMIAESYALMSTVLKMTAPEISAVFSEWNIGELKSYLIEITATVLARIDEETGKPLVDVILDSAEQKGTGKWTSQIALDLGVAAPTIAESVFSRCISALKSERVAAAKKFGAHPVVWSGDKTAVLEHIRRALFCSKICSYAQGFQLMRAADAEHKWNLNYKTISLIWREGCIIRAQFLNTIADAYAADGTLQNLLMNDYFASVIQKYEADWRAAVILGVSNGVALPTFSSALAYFDAYRTARLPASLTQGQRDYFGAHTYQRIDKEGVFHTQWSA